MKFKQFLFITLIHYMVQFNFNIHIFDRQCLPKTKNSVLIISIGRTSETNETMVNNFDYGQQTVVVIVICEKFCHA